MRSPTTRLSVMIRSGHNGSMVVGVSGLAESISGGIFVHVDVASQVTGLVSHLQCLGAME